MSATARWDWKKSSYTAPANNCVETKSDGSAVVVRDTKDHSAGVIDVAPGAWSAFIGGVRQTPFAA